MRCSTLVDPLVYQLEVHYAGADAKVRIFDIARALADNTASSLAVLETWRAEA